MRINLSLSDTLLRKKYCFCCFFTLEISKVEKCFFDSDYETESKFPTNKSVIFIIVLRSINKCSKYICS